MELFRQQQYRYLTYRSAVDIWQLPAQSLAPT